MPARSQGKLYMQRAAARLDGKDVHRRVFAHSLAPEVESAVREWLVQRLDGFHCDLQSMYTPHVVGPTLAGTHIVLDDARGLNAPDTVKGIIEATGSNPHMSVRGWPFCLDGLEGVDDMEGGVRRA